MTARNMSTECEVCLEDMVEPRTLPCGHTYCKTCLQQLFDSANNIVCPKDRRVFNVPNGNADNLTRNFFLEELLENLRNSRTTAAKVTCAEHADKPAEFFCERCLKSVCSRCVLKHNGHELGEYSDIRDKCALRNQQLLADVSKFKQAVDDVHTAKTTAVEAQVAACKHKVDAAVSKIRDVAKVLNTVADGLQSKTAQCKQLIKRAFRFVDLECLQREVTALSKDALRFTNTADDCKLETRFEQVEEFTQKLEKQRGKLVKVMSLSVSDVSAWFSDNELTRSLETVLNCAVKLKQNLANDTNDYLSLHQLKAALNEATTAVQTSTSESSTPRTALTLSNAQPPAVHLAAASNAAVATKLAAKPAQAQSQILLLAGGHDNDDAVAYDTSSDTWATVASMSCQRRGTAATLWQGKMVVAGGWNNTDYHLKSVEQFDQECNSWTALPDMLHKRSDLALACVDNTLYAIGGEDVNCYHNSVERYDTNTKRWQLASPLNVRRAYLCCAVLGEGILAVGGWDGSTKLDSCELFDGMKKKWQFVEPLQIPRRRASASTVDDKVYVFGGLDKKGERLNSVEEFAAGKWTLLTVQLSVVRCALAAATVNGRVYVCGGDPGFKVFECFDAGKMQISRVAQLPKEFRGAAAISVAVSNEAWLRLFGLARQ